MLAACLLGRPAEAKYGGGAGEPYDPYLIYTAEHMNVIGAQSDDWDKHFKLMADIDLSSYAGTDFNIIGMSMFNAFSGVFDGNGKTISNFIHTAASRDYSGLFGYLRGSEAEIRNLGLVDPNVDVGSGTCVGSLVGYAYEGTFTNCYARGAGISGKNVVGGLIGYAQAGTITNCRVEGGSVSGNEEVGGLVGHNETGIEDCYSACSVSGNRIVGGLIGKNRGAKIANSSATGMVSADEYNVGGLVGENSGPITNCFAGGDILGGRRAAGLVGKNSGTITDSCSTGNISGDDSVGGLVGNSSGVTISNCYATGIVSGDRNVGGLVGANSSVTKLDGSFLPGRIAYCYSTGSVTGITHVGGLVGRNSGGVISTSFWDIQTSGLSNMCGRQTQGQGCDDRDGKTTGEMQTEITFLDAGWDFVGESVNGAEDIWSICEGLDYPKLASQFLMGDFDGDSRVDLADFAVFAERWLSGDSSFLWCRGADLTNDGNVDFSDLKEFVENWLAEGIG